jgi:Ca2+-binding RTX toxin-like protein
MVMRRHVLLLVSLALATMLLASGVALAKNIGGDEDDNIIKGTRYADTIHGRGGDDELYGRRGRDQLYGENGEDKIYGNRGKDRIFTAGAHFDTVDCGRGKDFAEVDAEDVHVNCERVEVVTP